jgi:mannobiose 2-epimerase
VNVLLIVTALIVQAQQAPALDAPTARALREKLDHLLREELTTHWYPSAVDSDRGGFHENFARDWTPTPDDGAFVVYQGRLTWTAAAFADYAPDHRDAFAGYARHGIAFLDGPMRDREHGGFHWRIGADGKPDDEKHAYGLAFVIYAASVAHRLTGDPTALKVASDAFDWTDAHAHDAENGGYFEALKRDGTPIQGWPLDAPSHRRLDRIGVLYGLKSMNVHIHMLEALAELSKIDDRPVVRERLEEVFGIVRDKIAVEPGALNLYFTPDWRAVPAHDSFGHDVETAYLLVEAAEALGRPDDERTWGVARSLVDHALDYGWDAQNGGFYEKGEAFGPAHDTTKGWWTQAEGLNALLLMHRKYGKETDRYARAFLDQWRFIERHLIDPEHGGWFEATTRDGRLIGDGRKAQPWKANYHNARALINVARWLADIAEAGE